MVAKLEWRDSPIERLSVKGKSSELAPLRYRLKGDQRFQVDLPLSVSFRSIRVRRF